MTMSKSSLLQPSSAITVSAWLYFSSFTNTATPLDMPNGGSCSGAGGSTADYRLQMDSGAPHQDIYWQICVNTVWKGLNTQNLNPNQWYLVTGTYNGLDTTLYLNGAQVGSTSATGSITYYSTSDVLQLNYLSLASNQNLDMADVQVYNISLSANDVQYLYMEGIGGAPILGDGLVGWWPLNGNANDYSSNNNNGQTTNVAYTNTWTQGYTPP
jgi:hypothetical protein